MSVVRSMPTLSMTGFCLRKLIRIDDTFCQDPVAVFLRESFYFGVLGILSCLKNDLLLGVTY